MILAIVAVIVGLAVLVWSADKFVDGAVGIAEYCGMSTLLIGMVIVGFGTSAPELTVSAISASQGNPELALGNAYGSNIARRRRSNPKEFLGQVHFVACLGSFVASC